MNIRRAKPRFKGSFFAVIAACLPVMAAAVPMYTAVDLGTLPGRLSSIGLAINSSGQITGYAGMAFVGTIPDLGTRPPCNGKPLIPFWTA